MKVKHLLLVIGALPIIFVNPIYGKTKKDKKADMETISKTESPFRCNVGAFTEEQRKYHQSLSQELLKAVQEIREQPDGFSFCLPEDSSMVMKAAEFITLERLCCPFLAFQLTLTAEKGSLWVTLSGPEGVKDFLRAELGIDATVSEPKQEQKKQ